MKVLGVGILALTLLNAAAMAAEEPAAADKAADNMQIMIDKVRADKKLLVATNMKLTEDEAKGFWPVYDEYQKDLQQLNHRYEKGLKAYAEAYNKGPVPDATAKQLLEEMLAIDEAEAKLKRTYVPKLEKTLPISKVARYLQLETKIRSAVRYDLARRIPLIE
jgi:Spy/CpxP family protein refolding chaperone